MLWLLGLTVADTALFSAAQGEKRPDKALTDTLRILDGAIHRLGDPSSDYRKVLQDALGAFPAGADDGVRADIHKFLLRAPRSGPEFRCSVDFARVRAWHVLRRLRDTLLNETPSPLEPAVCYAVPFALDLTHVQSTDRLLDIYGFDFDAVALQMVLVTSEGYQDVTSHLVARSHYHLALKVGPGGVRVSSRTLSLGLAWRHLIHYSITMVQPTTPLCSSRIERIPIGRTVSHSPPFAGGEFFGRSRSAILAHASLEHSSNKLEATICVAGAEPAFDGCTVGFLYTTDPDRVIDGVFGTLSSHTLYDRGMQPHRANNRSGPVGQWVFSGFRPGSFEGGRVSVRAQFNEIRVVSSEGEGCISPVAYLEAKRTNVVDADTRRALDPALRRIDPGILKLRPRFAPPISP